MPGTGGILASLGLSMATAAMVALLEVSPTVEVLATAVVILGLAGVGLLQIVRRLQTAGPRREPSGEPHSQRVGDALIQALTSTAEWRAEVTQTLRSISRNTEFLIQDLRETRHSIRGDLAPLQVNVGLIEASTEGLQGVVHDFPRLLRQVDELHQGEAPPKRAAS